MSEELIKRLRNAAHGNMHRVMPAPVVNHLLREAADALSRHAPAVQAPGLTFNSLRAANAERIGASRYRKCEENWTPAHWMQATVGELGELANLLKKVDRGDFSFDQVKGEVAKELADVQTYLDILALKLDVDLGRATIDKFNEVSERIGSHVMLAAAPAPATVATEAVAHCGNEECGWSGPASDCVQPKHGGAVCCPECHDTAEMERIEPEPDGGQILIGEKWLSVDAPAARTWTGNTRPLFAGKAVAQGGGVDAEIARLLWNIPIRVCDGRVSMEYGYWDQVCRLLDKRRALLTAARAGVGGWQEGSE